MKVEPGHMDVPPVPGLGRLAWLLFMQPFQLHHLFLAWQMEEDPSLIRLWPRLKAREPIVLALLARWTLLLFVISPAVILGIATLLAILGVHVDWVGMALGVVLGVVACLVVGVAFGVVLGVALGLAGGVALSVTLGVAFGVAFGVARGVAFGVARGVAFGVLVGVVLGVAAGLVGGVVFGVASGVASGVAYCISLFRLLPYPFEALTSLFLAWRARLQPEKTSRLARWLPFLHHDLIYLPLPGLNSILVRLAESHPSRARYLIAKAAVSTGQKGVARRALIELQARDLERAARGRLFASVSDLDMPFLPFADTLDADSPIVFFQSAARDMRAGGNNHYQRRLALKRASKSLEDFIGRTTTSRRTDELLQRLLPTARLWLEVVRDEQHALAEAEARSPQVPSAFVAGQPLEPNDPQRKELFKGRRDLADLVGHDLDPDRRGVLVVIGQRRMGKSSFSKWLPILLGTGTEVLLADFQQLTGSPFRDTPHRWLVGLVATRFPDAPPPPDSVYWSDSLAWLRERDAMLADRRLLVVVDEVERVEDGIRRGELSTDFLDFLRAAGDTLRRIRFLVLTAYPLPRLGPHWLDRLISATTRNISYLDRDSAEELVRQPFSGFPDIYPEGGVDLILRETHCHPYLIQKVCDELCKYLNAQGGLRHATDEELEDVLEAVGSEDNLFAELWRQRTEEEKSALQRLACASEPVEADPTLRQLAREGFVELQGDRATLAVPLFGVWIRYTQGQRHA